MPFLSYILKGKGIKKPIEGFCNEQSINVSSKKIKKCDRIINALSIDVEDWFHLCAIPSLKPPEKWHEYESRVEINTKKILDILEEFDTKATFFVLGWVAEHHPEVVEEIALRGHEIGTHGYYHSLVYEQIPEEFENELIKSINVIEDISGKKVLGYRASSFSIKKSTEWAFDIMAKCGIKYDSSIFPAIRGQGGITSGEYSRKDIYEIETKHGTILEFPLSVISFFGKNLPVGGGGYFRTFPWYFTKWEIKRINKEGRSFISYSHPRDFDPDQPILDIPIYRKLKSYTGLKTSENKLRNMLKEFEFTSIENVLKLYR